METQPFSAQLASPDMVAPAELLCVKITQQPIPEEGHASCEHILLTRAGRCAMTISVEHPMITRTKITHLVSKAGRAEPVNLSKQQLRGIELMNFDLTGVNLSQADLDEANLCGITLCKADLHGSTLRKATLSWATVRQANISEVDLREADLSFADLSLADLHGSKLDHANLYGAILRSADLREACLDHADVRGADLSWALLEDTSGTGEIRQALQSRGAIFREMLPVYVVQPPSDTLPRVLRGGILGLLLVLLLGGVSVVSRKFHRPGGRMKKISGKRRTGRFSLWKRRRRSLKNR